ncbi:ACP S-malonyltransferase [Streptacidiphilus pinicola]|uniref:Malonyl CoA-acyl carrier protein transacylase n=1 Tax=Streptacidiphilus pinicola TaxID=2219663 RepID=A0A2X0IDE2_9ACTN|nr:ACP S-malonyltransferase [Streptacidiphilus pinicola]RAG81633.1 ACP S-malonyltransferase [Streptacidiphilus pinicola]
MTTPPSSAVLFPGQGVQRPGMGDPWRGSDVWQLVETVSQASGHDVAELLLTSDEAALARTDRAQIAVFTASLLAWQEFREQGRADSVVALAGHSLGEYTALVAAGVLSLTDGARLVGERGRAMAEAARRRPGAMAAVMGGGPETVERLVSALREEGEDIWAANYNSPQQTVVAGSRASVVVLAARAASAELRCSLLPVTAACHSPYLADAEPALRAALNRAEFRAGTVPVIANVDARPHHGGPHWRELSARQLTSPVHWCTSLITLHTELGVTDLTDIGPGRTLASLARRTLPTVPAQSFASLPVAA